MVCKRCKRRFEPDEAKACPHCGEPNPRAQSGVLKTSTILISSGKVDAVYRSVKEIPVPLRKRLLKSTNGLNSATILIADRRGRQEISKAIRNLPSNLQQRLFATMLGGATADSALRWLTPAVRRGIAVAFALLCLVLVWAVLTHHW